MLIVMVAAALLLYPIVLRLYEKLGVYTKGSHNDCRER